jgi:hypothetical protein
MVSGRPGPGGERAGGFFGGRCNSRNRVVCEAVWQEEQDAIETVAVMQWPGIGSSQPDRN